MQLNTPKYYSLDELALILGCAKNILRYDPSFPKGLKVGKRRVVYDMDEVKTYLESNRIGKVDSTLDQISYMEQEKPEIINKLNEAKGLFAEKSKILRLHDSVIYFYEEKLGESICLFKHRKIDECDELISEVLSDLKAIGKQDIKCNRKYWLQYVRSGEL